MTSSTQMFAQRAAITTGIPFITAKAVEQFCNWIRVDNIFGTINPGCEGIRAEIDLGIARRTSNARTGSW